MTTATAPTRAPLPRNDLRHHLDGPLTPSEPALSEAACDELLRPLYVGGHLHLSPEADAASNLASLVLVRRGQKDTPLGTGSTLAAAKRQAAERVRVFGANRILECW